MPRHCTHATIVLAIITLFSASSAHAGDKPERKPGRTEISDVPWSPGTTDRGKVVYGTDDRRDVFEETDAQRRILADSTCALVDASTLTLTTDGDYALRVSAYRINGLPPCDGEPFSNQPTAAYCTGFVVGPDLIATAGHCYAESDLSSTRFVFGFRMTDATTPRVTFDATEVYFGVEVVARQLEGDFDYSIIRLDRPIEAPGAEILRLRSAGTIPVGARVGLVGHPTGLPTKIAFGDSTLVRASDNAGYFSANLDAFGGNSGSPVFNAESGLVEGILVRGEPDFTLEDDCFRARVLPNDSGGGEEVSKASTFARFVQAGRGAISLDRAAYGCTGPLAISLFDQDLEGAGTTEVTIFTSGGDLETITLDETGRFGTFGGTLTIAAGAPTPDDGTLQAAEGDTIYATYRDADIGTGAPGDAVVTARVDCTAPTISDVVVEYTGGNRARIAFTTSEPTSGIVSAGRDCATLNITAAGELTTNHQIEVRGLTTLTDYAFTVAVEDAAGNTASDDNGGACYTFTTTDQRDFYTESFFDGITDLNGRSITFTPDSSVSGYTACVETADGFPTSPFCGEPLDLGDDDSVEYALQSSRTVTYFGQSYPSIFVGSNGYITFGGRDTNYEPSLEAHFEMPRISGYFSDLYPPDGGLISVAELDDRIAVTYYNVFDYFGDRHSFQIELFDDGAIRMTWVFLTYPYGIVGLSDGSGLDPTYEESDLSGYTQCDASPYAPVECAIDVPNDACDDAIPATLGQDYTGLTHSAMGSSDVPGCAYCYDPDVWYTFTPGSTGTYTLSLCNSDFDTVLDLFSGDCGQLDFITGNDDGYCGYPSTLVAELTQGETYWVRISGYEAITGNYDFKISFGAKNGFGCNPGGGAPGNPLTEALLLAGVVLLLAWRARVVRSA